MQTMSESELIHIVTLNCRALAIYHYEGRNLVNQKNRKFGVFHRKLEGSQSLFYCCFDIYIYGKMR